MKTNRLKNNIIQTLRATATCLLLIPLLTACDSRREFTAKIDADEPVAVRQEVQLDGRTAGYVASIKTEGADRVARLRIIDRTALIAIRVGVERIPGTMHLTTLHVAADAPPLAQGAMIPTSKPLATATTMTLNNLEDFAWDIRDYLTDHPAAGIAAAAVTLLIVIGLLRAIFRKAFCLLLVAAAIATTAHAGPPKPAEVEADIQNSATMVARAEEFAAESRHLVMAGLTQEAGIAGVRAYFGVDQSDASDKENVEKVDRISGWRANSEDKESLREHYQSLKLRRAAVEDGIAQVAAKIPNGLISLYLVERARIKTHIANGDADDKWVLQQLSSLARLGKAAAPLIEAQALTIDNVAGVTLDQGNIIFPNGKILALESRPVTAPVIVTNVVIRTNIVRVTTPAPPALKVVEYVTNTQSVFVDRTNVVMVTNQPTVATAAGVSGLTGVVSAVSIGNKPTNSVVAATHEPPPHLALPPPADSGGTKTTHLPSIGKVGVVLALVLLVIAVVVFGVASNARQHPAMIDLAEAETGSTQGIILAGSNDVLVLDDDPHSAPKELRGPNAAISRDWLGRAVLLAVEGTSINGLTRTGKIHLHSGDRVTLAESVGGQTWIFGGISAVQSPTMEEPIEANS